jgi:putative addiction module component (TIGR02574 family)
MKESEERVIVQALRLPKTARAALVVRLLETLDTEVDEDAEEAWDEEIAKRLEEIDSGRVKLVPWSEARRQIIGDPRCLVETLTSTRGRSSKHAG